MNKNAAQSKPQGAYAKRQAKTGQFMTVVAALKPATKQGSISIAQAEKAVKTYLSASPKT